MLRRPALLRPLSLISGLWRRSKVQLPSRLWPPSFWVSVLAGLIVVGAGAWWKAASAAPEAMARRLSLYGEALPTGAGAADEALARVRKRVAQWFRLELPEGTRQVSYGALGVEIDRARLRGLVAAYEQTPQSRGLRAKAAAAPLELIVPLRLNLERAWPTLLALKHELDRTPQDARLELDQGAVVPERTGRLLDIDGSLRAIQAAIESGSESAALVFELQTPRRLAAELSQVQHDALLGFFETPYDLAARARDRTFNLELAASRLDGYVLMPGQQFDFNQVVGPRDEAHGYRVATVIAEGELVDGIGGGTCQISGTLHAAALFAGLEIVERYPHTRPSSYIKLGFDAAVVYPTVNLRLGNPYPFPVVLRETVRGGRVRAEVRGAARPHTTTVVRRIEAARPFEQIERADESLPKGTRVLAQRGVPAFDVKRYRIVRDGPHARREVVVDRYPATAQIVRVGAGERGLGSGRLSSAPQPEYLADELLVLNQTRESETALLEQRTPGRFGVAGWTREIGAPVWPAPAAAQ